MCCYCTPHHVIGKEDGSGLYTHGLCWKAALREDVKWYAGKFCRALRRIFRTENALVITAALYFGGQLVRWGFNGFAIVGK
jgi:hypothetical protein